MIGRGIWVVTGTDTDVGKTVATAWLAHRERAAGHSVAIYKVAQTGVTQQEAGDADTVAALVPGVTTAEGVRLPEPLAPSTAARRAGLPLPGIDAHVAAVRALGATHDVVLVEGSGGVLVGLTADGHSLLDLALRLEAPVVVVARAGLGTLNHTALTCATIRSSGLTVTGVLVGSWPKTPDLAARCNVVDLPAAAGAPLLGGLRAGCSSDLANALVTPQEMMS